MSPRASDENRRNPAGLTSYQQDQIRREAGLEDADTEFAADVAPAPISYTAPLTSQENETVDDANKPGIVMGYIALLLAVVSLFIAPALLGSAATLLGFFSYVQGRRALGIWSIVIGLISLAGYFLLVPLYA